MQPSTIEVDTLSAFPFINANLLADLKVELPHYLAKAADVSSHCDPLEWWKGNEPALPFWAATAKKVLLVQPSSAATDRVFSLLKASFGDQQQQTVQDYLETSLMLQYNKN